ncbi:DUF4293 domain-containing protein [Pedobacter sp. ASV1-7]|uniref:DUF4293 domain-containing protein n=1 Tax=Pedobacter sp. ASV1-7 TaxID=3145237 RepID=UPI0032E883A6
MIQRVQSIWLLLATLALICLLFLPLLTKTLDNIEYRIYTTGQYQHVKVGTAEGIKTEISIVPMALNIAAALFCFASIFLFRNRSMQKKVILVAILIIIALSVLCGINTQQLPGGTSGISLEPGTFLPLIAIVFSMLAIGGIKKDEQLLKSADRLR